MNQDYFMRAIESLGDVLDKYLYNNDRNSDDKQTQLYIEVGDNHPLRQILKRMVELKKINEAENLLFNTLDSEPTAEVFAIGIDFYKSLSKMSREELEACDFSYEEILSGMEDMKNYQIKFD